MHWSLWGANTMPWVIICFHCATKLNANKFQSNSEQFIWKNLITRVQLALSYKISWFDQFCVQDLGEASTGCSWNYFTWNFLRLFLDGLLHGNEITQSSPSHNRSISFVSCWSHNNWFDKACHLDDIFRRKCGKKKFDKLLFSGQINYDEMCLRFSGLLLDLNNDCGTFSPMAFCILEFP